MEESAKHIGATVIPAGSGNTMMQVKILQMLEVNGFLGTPSFLTTLVQRAEAMGLDIRKDILLETALVTAEMLPESLRARLQEKLDMTVRQAYGTVFLGCIGFECQAMSGLHVPDSIWVEIVDPATGRQVPSGSVGEIVATNFNPFYPMIRMATGDLSRIAEEPCPCGRTGPLLKKIIGRMDQAAKVGGVFIHPWQADDVMSSHPEVFKYQMVITRKNHLDLMTVIVELKEDLGETLSLQRKMEREIEEMLGVRSSIRIVARGTLPDGHRKIEDQRKWE
jgi:phenylacetate-CoA ligase